MSMNHKINGRCVPGHAVIFEPTKFTRMQDALASFLKSVILGVHTHNQRRDTESGEYLALSFPDFDLEADYDKMCGRRIRVVGNATALEDFLRDTPQIDKMIAIGFGQHNGIVGAREDAIGKAFVRERKTDRSVRVNRAKRTEPDFTAPPTKSLMPHFRVPTSRFFMCIAPLEAPVAEEGRVNTYGLSTKQAPLAV